jgi:uncharacterized membrane protein
MQKWMAGFIGFLTLLYPVAIYFGIQHFGIESLEPWKISLALLLLILLRMGLSKHQQGWNQLLFVLGIIYCLLAVWNNNLITLRFYPVLISLSLFIVFTASLFYPPPIIERFARLQHPELPEQGIRYTRKVTYVWCVFFALNGLVAAITAVWSSFAVWSLYNGLISYLLMGCLMAVEYGVRIRTQDHVR